MRAIWQSPNTTKICVQSIEQERCVTFQLYHVSRDNDENFTAKDRSTVTVRHFVHDISTKPTHATGLS